MPLAAIDEEAFAREVQDAYRRLREDHVAWMDYMDEVALWDQLAGEGLPDDGEWRDYDEEP